MDSNTGALNKAITDGQGNLHSAVVIDTTSPSEYYGMLAEPIDFWTYPNFMKDRETFNTFIASHQAMCNYLGGGHDRDFFVGKNISDFIVVASWGNVSLIIALESTEVSGQQVISFDNGYLRYVQVPIDSNGVIQDVPLDGSTRSIPSIPEHNAGSNIEYFSWCFYFRYARVLVEEQYVYGYYAQINDKADLYESGSYFTGIIYKIPFPYTGQISLQSGMMLKGGSVEYGHYIPDELWTTETIAPSGTGGGYGSGGGSYDTSSVSIPFAHLPTLSAINTGLLNLYKPTVGALQSLGGYLWSTSFLDNIQKLWQDPMDLIVSLNILPITPTTSGSSSIKIGSIDTNIPAQIVATQYHQFNCGTLSIGRYFGSALDYSPYTKVQCFVPYVGIIDLDTDDVMNSSVSIQYNIDVFNGEFFCQIKCYRVDEIQGVLDSVLYTYTGNMASNLPISAKNYSNIMRSLTMSAIGMASGSAGVSDVASGVASSIAGTKPTIQRTGNMSNSGSFVGIRTPYLIITRPIQALPKHYDEIVGYPSNITAYLYQLEGFTKVGKLISNTLSGTQEEQDEIIALLKEGVFL